MRVEYPVNVGGKTVVISEECAKDTDAFEFICHMNEVYGNMTCTKNGESSDKVELKVRISGAKKHKYYEVVCMDDNPKLKYARRGLGVKEEGNDNLFPQRKWPEGHKNAGEWLPDNGWLKYNKEKDCDE
jgi:hypothetical protein